MTILAQSAIKNLALKTGMTTAQASIASAIAMAESSGDTNAVNPGHSGDPEYSVGLWQINLRSHPEYSISQMKDPVQNSFAMFTVSNGGTNWKPWGSYTDLRYKQYLNATDVSTTVVTQPTYSQTSSTQFASLSSIVQTNKATLSDVGSGYQYILAYVVAISIFVLICQTRIGYRAVYYGLCLLLLLLLVTQSKFIVTSLAPLSKNDTSTPATVTL